ncbi:Translation elongation factor EF1A [Blastocystis hominis]|uniref:Translation elongation factor EF1A n=1 Tax=Blastocystis hominis TaxID=12968 RepID=D8M358_BLAHO|nr:Translation elongation factor EF1A [Blastocystis hominis]CBK22781.2 Translation elongation factor EF1A [Blastocystis hominis]|eukprot:XP_012896829.1 Translation elongation factor EF1A [Blastocystis hominis]
MLHSTLSSQPTKYFFTFRRSSSPPALVEGKETVTVLIAGHVDHGKSTITGHLLVECNVVSEREMRKATKEAKELGKQSFNYAFLMDQNPEERTHGVTIHLGAISLQTEERCVTLLDAPGHRDFVAAMIAGGLRADAGILVISAQKGEFEAGWSTAGITKEHLLIMVGSGIETLAILVNKMDTVHFSKLEARFLEIQNTVIPYLKHLGFKRKNVTFIPTSGLEGVNLSTVDSKKTPWFTGPSLIHFLNSLSRTMVDSDVANTKEVVMTVHDVYRGDMMGDCIAAHVARGFLDSRDLKPLILLPAKLPLTVKSFLVNNHKATVASAGNNVVLITAGIDLASVSRGNVITTTTCPMKPSNRIIAQIFVNKEADMPIMKGLTVLLHLDGNVVSAVIQHVLAQVDFAGNVQKAKPKVVYGGQWASVELALDREVFVADFKSIPAMSRFIMQDKGVTMGIGRVTEVKKSKFHRVWSVCLNKEYDE